MMNKERYNEVLEGHGIPQLKAIRIPFFPLSQGQGRDELFEAVRE
jgi:hypothetical protein